MGGKRFNCLGPVCIMGYSSRTCTLYSNLSSGQALITSTYTTPIHDLSLQVPTGAQTLSLVGDRTAGLVFYDTNWIGGKIGTISNYTNVIFSSCAFLAHSDGITFDGTIDAVGMDGCVFAGTSAPYHIYLPATLTFTRRFRIIYSAITVVNGGINYASASIPDEGFILDTVNFSGGGTYVNGITNQSNITNWINCVGIANSFTSGIMYLQENATPTTFTLANTYAKIVGTTTTDAGGISKFTHTNGRLTYTGSRSAVFEITVSMNVSGGTNKNGSLAIAYNNSPIPTSDMRFRTSGTGNFLSTSSSHVMQLNTTDYIEIFIRNITDATSMTVEDLVCNIIRLF